MKPEPPPEFFIEKLSRGHDASAFDCGNQTLTNWLQKFAWSNQQADSAKTYVACRENRVVGYYALTAGSVHKHETPERIAKGLANHRSASFFWLASQSTLTRREKGSVRPCCSMHSRE